MTKYVSLEDVKRMAFSMMGLSNTEWVQALQGLPTIDIVQCKECKWWPDRCMMESTGSNDFCSRGKEEDFQEPICSNRGKEQMMNKKKPCGLDFCPLEKIIGAYASCSACAWSNDGDNESEEALKEEDE